MSDLFLTVPDEMLEHAHASAAFLRGKGFRVSCEPADIRFPSTPTLLAKRSHTTLIVDVQHRVDVVRLTAWAHYGRTCSTDTRGLVAVAADYHMPQGAEMQLVELGIGVIVSDGERAYERLAPKDQQVMQGIPPRDSLPRTVSLQLAETYDKFDHGEWRDGFKKACQTVEVRAREYLLEGMRTSRISLVTPTGKPSSLTIEAVGRQPAGKLAETFGKIAQPNVTEKLLGQALRHLNDDRVGAIHYEERRRTESQLRRNVGQHMIVVVNALKAISGES